MTLTDHAIKNREAWTGYSADYFEAGRREWAKDEPSWGIFHLPESEVGALGNLAELKGKDAIELGCGTGYVSAWLHKLGAKPVGIDLTPAQLDNARKFQDEFGIEFPLIEGTAEDIPLPDGTFDLAISEYGASIWCDPYLWIPEAARLLRPGGMLVFLRNSTTCSLCTPVNASTSETMCRTWAELARIEDGGAVEFQIPHGEMIRLLRKCGFEIEDLIELVAPSDATTRYDWMPVEWATRWPAEEIWKARKK